MRIERLSLLRYGAFQDRHIDLPDAPLTVIYGANEAGKTTLLEALGWALFGFPASQFPKEVRRPDFRFAMTDLRLGAVLSNDKGERLAFERRKGKVRTLLDADGAALPDDSLLPYLGTCNHALFNDLFGLDQPRLRLGGRALLKDGGALGESLLSAGAALRGATMLRHTLEEDADKLFAPQRRRANAFNAAESAFEHARKAQKEALRTKRALDEARNAFDTAEAAVTEARAATAELESARRRDEQLRAVIAPLAELARLRDEEAEDAALQPLDSAALARLKAAAEAAFEAAEAHRMAEASSAALLQRLEAAPAPSPAWQHRAEIDALYRAVDDIRGQITDLPKRETELAAAERALDEAARRLGLERAAFDSRTLDDLKLAEIRTVLSRGVELERKCTELEEAIALSRAKTRPEDVSQQPDTARDPRPLRLELADLDNLPEAHEAATRAQDEAIAALKARDSDAARMNPALPDMKALMAFSPPTEGQLGEAERHFEALQRGREALENDQKRLEEAMQAQRAQLIAISGNDAPPTRAELTAARNLRDATWRSMRREGVAEHADDFEAQIADADRLADHRESASIAVQSREAAEKALTLSETQLRTLAERADALAVDREAATAAWHVLWQPLSPGTPREMADWRSRRLALIDSHAEATRRQAESLRMVERVAAQRARLDALAVAVDIATPNPQPSETLIAMIEQRVHMLEESFARRGSREERERDLNEKIADLKTKADALAAWRGAWGDHAQILGLSEMATLEAALAAVEVWRAVPTQRGKHADILDRVTKIRANITAFESRVSGLTERMDRGILPDDPLAAIITLQERRDEDQSRADERKRLETEAKSAQTKLIEAKSQSTEADAAFADLSAAIDNGNLPAQTLIPRIEHIETLRQAQREQLARLRDLAPDTDEATLRAALGELSAPELDARLAATGPERNDADARLVEAIESRRDARQELERFEKPGVEAETNQQMRNAEAAMEMAAQEWLTLRTAALLLGEATRHYREANADPVIAKATDIFARLTLGAFTALKVEMDEQDSDELRAVRASGEEVRIDGLSEGTLDQLFLALRLAAIERRLDDSAPIPFIGDDLFTSFDDARMMAGLDVLAGFGARSQTLIFTHHRRVADAAREMSGRAAVIEIGV